MIALYELTVELFTFSGLVYWQGRNQLIDKEQSMHTPASRNLLGLSATFLYSLGWLVTCVVAIALESTAVAQSTPAGATPPAASGSVKANGLDVGGPPYFMAHYHHMRHMPLAAGAKNQGGFPATIAQFESDPDAHGQIGSYQPAGETVTATNAFFQSLGTNGRACFTCHQPAFGMSISVKDIDERFQREGLRDPLFAPVDGSTCPKNVPSASTKPAPEGGSLGQGTGSLADAYKTLLQRGLLRIAIPLNAPPRTGSSAPTTEFTIAVLSDPYGCNTDPQFNQDVSSGQPVIDPDTGKPVQIISIYRRPRMSASLNFATTAFAFSGPPTITTPSAQSGNIMWDGREPTLESQARDATLGHAQADNPPTAAQVAQIVAFETGFFSAQVRGPEDLELAYAVFGGPVVLSAQAPEQHTALLTFPLYSQWLSPPSFAQNKALRESIARGEGIFNTRTFQITNDAGINALPTAGKPSAPITGACSACHSQKFSGNDTFVGAQQDQGIGGSSASFGGPSPSPFLPIFKITCKSGVTLGFHGTIIETNDPGLALITGKCADVGKLTVPQLRGLASRPPYFSDGSAATLLDVVNFYDKRFQIHFNPQEKNDLVNFLNAL